jgi:1,4-alpha-glucan branching enzyme
MYQKNAQRNAKVMFSLNVNTAGQTAYLAGDFTNWKPVKMQQQPDGRHAVLVPLTSGTHQYKFLLGKQWIVDPENSSFAVSNIGTINSVAHLD